MKNMIPRGMGIDGEEEWQEGVEHEKEDELAVARIFQKRPSGLIFFFFNHLHSKAFSWMFISDPEF